MAAVDVHTALKLDTSSSCQYNSTCGTLTYMRHNKGVVPIYEVELSSLEFIKYYNQNVPAGFPLVSRKLLERFQASHASLFKKGDLWTIDQHRKKIMDWLPLNYTLERHVPR